MCVSMNRQWSHPLQLQEEHPVMDSTQLHKTQRVQKLEGNRQTEHNQLLPGREHSYTTQKQTKNFIKTANDL